MRVSLELKQDGKGPLYPIYFRISDRQKRSIKRTDIEIKTEQWDAKNKVIINHRDAGKLNRRLALKMQEIKTNTFDTNDNSFGEEKRHLFSEVFKDFLIYKKYDVKNTQDRITCLLAHLNEFKPVKFLDEIDLKYLNTYYLYLRDKRGLAASTIKIDLVFLRSIINYAVKIAEVLPYAQNPFNKFQIPNVKNGKPKFLTAEQVNKIHDAVNRGLLKTNKNSPVHACAVWFLLSCYTGLRISDLEQFNEKMIVNDTIILTMKKTEQPVVIPVIKEAWQIIEMLKTVLPFNRAWQIRIIGQVGEFLGFDETLHFHVARHTFATNCARNLIGIEVTQKLLGHSKSSTTEIYYHLENQVVKNEMLTKFKF